MWVDKRGNNLTTDQVREIIHNGTGSTMPDLHKWRPGRIYQNGGMWFQRISLHRECCGESSEYFTGQFVADKWVCCEKCRKKLIDWQAFDAKGSGGCIVRD